jgi:DNA repair protein RadA/Sms
MSKNLVFICQNCGATYQKWQGKCDACGEWNTIIEEKVSKGPKKSITATSNKNKADEVAFVSLYGKVEDEARFKTDIKELDRVCGGGLVKGSVILLGGDPGIGKSTILLQACSQLAQDGIKCTYISGEESINQVRLRASRLGVAEAEVDLANETNVRNIVSTLDKAKPVDVVVIDSIQTMFVDTLDSAPGTVSQVRAAAYELVKLAKSRGFVLFIVGHVTKEGSLAGPRILEHMVDTVLYFEGERSHHFRILRAVKNRFGATDEIGVFEMGDKGLSEVENPSALFLAERRGNITGSAVFAGIEGTRPILLEIQALLSPSNLSSPRRAVVGWDLNRLNMITAVLQARAGEKLYSYDIYLNIAGGLKITEPAADLSVAAALLSSKYQVPTPHNAVFLGEIGLSGEVRTVPNLENRLKEAEKLGFKRAYIPKRIKVSVKSGLELKTIGHLEELKEVFG